LLEDPGLRRDLWQVYGPDPVRPWFEASDGLAATEHGLGAGGCRVEDRGLGGAAVLRREEDRAFKPIGAGGDLDAHRARQALRAA
jgi:hypothetical protein